MIGELRVYGACAVLVGAMVASLWGMPSWGAVVAAGVALFMGQPWRT